MKKFTLLIVLFITTITIAQEKEFPQDINKKHEIKLNTFNLIVISSFDIGYEYLIHKDYSFGANLLYNFNNTNDFLLRDFSLTPYFRSFFSEKHAARGFFIEAFGMLNINKDKLKNGTILSETNFALGVSAGGKFVTRKGFIAEIYLGVGRNLFKLKNNILDTNIVGRGGISLGYRF